MPQTATLEKPTKDHTPESNTTTGDIIALPTLAEDVHQTEFAWAKAIAETNRPVIFVTERSAQNIGGRSRTITSAMPNVPIVCENYDAYLAVKKSRFLCEEFRQNVIGYCQSNKNDGDCPILKETDVLVIMGTPHTKTEKEMQGVPCIKDCAGNGAKINFALVADFVANTAKDNEWHQWMQSARNTIERGLRV